MYSKTLFILCRHNHKNGVDFDFNLLGAQLLMSQICFKHRLQEHILSGLWYSQKCWITVFALNALLWNAHNNMKLRADYAFLKAEIPWKVFVNPIIPADLPSIQIMWRSKDATSP